MAVLATSLVVWGLVSADHKRDFAISGLSRADHLELKSAINEALGAKGPRASLVKDEQGFGVFEIVAGKAHRIPVALLIDDGPTVSVLGTLDPARTIVTTGAYELEDGTTVTEPAS